MKVDKDEMLSKMKATVDVKIAVARQAATTFTFLAPCMEAIDACFAQTMENPDDVMKNLLMNMTSAQLLKLQEGINSSNNASTRLNHVQKFAFRGILTVLINIKIASAVIDDAMTEITAWSFNSAYYQGCTIDWKLFNKHLMMALTRKSDE